MFLLQAIHGQERTVIEFYDKTPAVSDYIIPVETRLTNRVQTTASGWKIPPGQNVRIEIPYAPPNMNIREIRLGFNWSGGVVSGLFQGFIKRNDIFRVFEEIILPNETQKRIYTDMHAREYEFRVISNFHQRSEATYLLLESLIIFWMPVETEQPEEMQKD